MTAAELIEIRIAKEATKQRKAPKKPVAKHKDIKSRVRKELIDEFDEYVNTSDDELKILKCIEVEI